MSHLDTDREDAEAQEMLATASDDSVESWQVEAEKWKELAAKNDERAKENEGAVERLQKLESTAEQSEAQAAEKVAEVEQRATEETEEARRESAKSVDEWQAEAEHWKKLSRDREKQAKANFNAAKRLEQLEAAEAEKQAKASDDASDAEKRATKAEARALRYEVSLQMGVPEKLRSFLTGKTRLELEKQADELLASINDDPDSAESRESDVDEEAEAAKTAAEKATEIEKRAADAEAKALRYEVAADKGLSAELAKFLSATNRTDLEEQADVLLSVAKREVKDDDGPDSRSRLRRPREALRSGAAPDVEPERSTADLATAILKKARGY